MTKVMQQITSRHYRKWTPYKIINGIGYYMVDGGLVTERNFYKRYPIPAHLRESVQLDGRRSYLKEEN